MASFNDWTTVASWNVELNTGDTKGLNATHELSFEEDGGVKKVTVIAPASEWATGLTYATIGDGTVDPVDMVSGELSDTRKFEIKRSVHGSMPQLDCTIDEAGGGETGYGGTWMAQDGSGGSGEGGGIFG